MLFTFAMTSNNSFTTMVQSNNWLLCTEPLLIQKKEEILDINMVGGHVIYMKCVFIT